MPRFRHRRAAMAGLCIAMTASPLAACSASPASPGNSQAHPASSPVANEVSAAGKPNIVYVLTDDLSWNLVKYMPHVRQMEKDGATFTNFFATDSLCCPSRSTIFTGEFPHNTGVFTNNGNDGGYRAFNKKGNEKKCFAPSLQHAGYQTGFMGKYLNGYQPADKHGTSKPYVPPGWNEWDTAGNGYPEFNYNLNENGKLAHYGHTPEDYLTDVVSKKASSYIGSSAAKKKPFMLELATFAPHAPSTPAPRDAHKYPSLTAPHTAAYGKTATPTPKWQSSLPPLTDKDDKSIDKKFVKRVRSVQAVDAMIGHLQDQLKAKGLDKNTYFMFGSDNGFHMGEHQLRPGKQTAYDTDIKVPLMVTGPGVKAGAHISQLAQNTDLNPTFQELAGGKPSSTVDGQSLAGLLHGKQESDWRQSVLVEHHHPASKKDDPDAAPDDSGNPPSYEALRTEDKLYVEYTDGEREFYSTKTDPAELKNLAASASPQQRKSMHDTLTALKHCHGSESCKAASHIKK